MYWEYKIYEDVWERKDVKKEKVEKIWKSRWRVIEWRWQQLNKLFNVNNK